MNIKIKTNLIGGIVAAVFSIVLFSLSFKIEESISTGSSVGSAFFPKMMAILIFLLSMGMLIQSIITKKYEIIDINVSDEIRVLLFLGIIVVYIISLKYLGFLIATIAMNSSVLWVLKSRKWKAYAICIVAAFVVYAGFRYGLRINLPRLMFL